jgi:hypothetical protein
MVASLSRKQFDSPIGVQVSSDASMSDWMGTSINKNRYQQTLQVSKCTTTTDENGAYSLQWIPYIAGKYNSTRILCWNKRLLAIKSSNKLCSRRSGSNRYTATDTGAISS